MKVFKGRFDDRYSPSTFEDDMPLNIPVTGVTKPTPQYYADLRSAYNWISCYQFEYVTGGKGYIEIEGKVTTVTEGDLFFINKDVPRIVYSDKDDPMKKIYVSASGKFVDGIVDAYNMTLPLIVCRVDVYEHLQKILQIVKKAEAYTPQVSDEIGDEILKIVRKIYYENAEGKRTLDKSNIAESIMSYIEWNFSHKFTIEDMMNTFYLGKTQLIKHFKDRYGTTPMKYVQDKRIEVSKHYLKNTDVPISTIHDSIGFSDAKYFSVAFKASTGMSPREYRNKYKAKFEVRNSK